MPKSKEISISAGILGYQTVVSLEYTDQVLKDLVQYGFGHVFNQLGINFTTEEIHGIYHPNEVIRRTNAVLLQLFISQNSLWEVSSTIFLGDNLTKGIAFICQLEERLKKGMTIEKAIVAAAHLAKSVPHSGCIYDVIPYIDNEPLINSPFQYSALSYKQLEILSKWVINPNNPKGECIQFLALLGRFITTQTSPEEMLGVGFGYSDYPQNLFFEPSDFLDKDTKLVNKEPIINSINFLQAQASQFAACIYTDKEFPVDKGHEFAWNQYLYFIRYIKELPASDHIVSKFITCHTEDLRIALLPFIKSLFDGIVPITDINWSDKFHRILGFKSTVNSDRVKFQKFLIGMLSVKTLKIGMSKYNVPEYLVNAILHKTSLKDFL